MRVEVSRPHGLRALRRVPKLCGADIELGNFVLGAGHRDGTAAAAASALLREIPARVRTNAFRSAIGSGASATADPYWTADWTGDPRDWGRKFLPNGSCVYIDLNHVECCTPETLSAWDHVACWHALLRIVRLALAAANARRAAPGTICALANNSDGRGHAYGSHLNFLLARAAWDNTFRRKIHYLLYLAAFQVSSIVYTGAGKVGAENGAPPVRFQLAQRADFFETLTGEQTTRRRPLVNSRDEPLCGAGGHADPGLARLHSIFFDSTLCHVSSLLKVGVTQIVLAMIEAERIKSDRILDDPLAALRAWSHDPTLRARAQLASRRRVTAVELQRLFLEDAARFVATGGCAGVVPRAEEILALWSDTLDQLDAGDLAALARRLDWVLKLQILAQALRQRPDLSWASPEIKHLEFLYSSLGPEGLYWAYDQGGLIEPVVSVDDIARSVQEPPADTRAWTRGMLLRTAPEAVAAVDWDAVRFRLTQEDSWPRFRTVHLADPLGATRAHTAAAFRNSTSLDELLERLAASGPDVNGTPTRYDWKTGGFDDAKTTTRS